MICLSGDRSQLNEKYNFFLYFPIGKWIIKIEENVFTKKVYLPIGNWIIKVEENVSPKIAKSKNRSGSQKKTEKLPPVQSRAFERVNEVVG